MALVAAAARPILTSCTHPAWFARSSADLLALLSDHLHCERKAAENALSLVRRYPHRGPSVTLLGRLAHEETSHVVQVAALIGARGWVPRADTPNRYARALLAEVRGVEPERLLDALLAAAFIEARSHERL
ncbi:MAG TPA: tRNA isopentenyl-2-thiomethyl-A-37 hydroxylase MiaE, partial [Polyangia bacterium]|nr:tRNA isopentenyl-2-thiomethyl-A-37 hydroxylase MiaE [Polyangia bacterium]